MGQLVRSPASSGLLTHCVPGPLPSCLLSSLQPDFEEVLVLPLKSMPLNEKGQCFTVLKRAAGGLATGKMMNVLKFTVKEIDPSTGEAEEEGYEDEYQVRPRVAAESYEGAHYALQGVASHPGRITPFCGGLLWRVSKCVMVVHTLRCVKCSCCNGLYHCVHCVAPAPLG